MDIQYSFSGQNISLVVGAIGSDEDLLVDILRPNAEASVYLQSLTAPGRRLEWLTARCLIKHLSPYDYDVIYDFNGKPIPASGMYSLSISHGQQLAGVVVDSHHRSIGVDLERISDRALRVRHKYMADVEDFFPADEAPLYCTLLWSAKEVLYKIMGRDYVDFKKFFRILPFRFSEQGGLMHAVVQTPHRQEAICLHYRQIQDSILVWGVLN